MADQIPWQLQAFDKTLKKRIKIGLISSRLGDLKGAQCLMVSCGENNGAINYRLRQLGGSWTWAEFESIAIEDMEDLLDEPVLKLSKESPTLPWGNETFDVIIALDAHEHLQDPDLFTEEIARIAKPGGRAIVSVPSANGGMLVSRMKRLAGMQESLYGHLVPGYEIRELEEMLSRAGLRPYLGRYYSKFFTEFLELLLNFAYVRVFSSGGGNVATEDTVAPTTRDQMNRISGGMKLYSLVYPIFRLVSSMDALLPARRGYAALVEAAKDS